TRGRPRRIPPGVLRKAGHRLVSKLASISLDRRIHRQRRPLRLGAAAQHEKGNAPVVLNYAGLLRPGGRITQNADGEVSQLSRSSFHFHKKTGPSPTARCRGAFFAFLQTLSPRWRFEKRAEIPQNICLPARREIMIALLADA